MHYKSIYREGLFSSLLVVITGGGSGIGRCMAHELTALSAKVVITGREQGKLDRVAKEIREDGGTPNTHPGYAIPDHNRSEPFQGFHRSTVPAMLQTRQNEAEK